MSQAKQISRRTLFKHLLIPVAAAVTAPIVGHAQTDFSYETVELTAHLPRLHPNFNGFRIVQLSDIHYDGVGMRPEWLERVVADINSLQPDLVVLTGDYAIDSARHYPALVPELGGLLRGLQAKHGVLAIHGNHDYRRGVQFSRELFDIAHAQLLENEVVTIERDGAKLDVAGFDDYNESQPDLPRVVSQLNEQSAAISLLHEPDTADITAQTGRFDLQLSGHSHGGQVRNASGQPITLPRNGQKYHSGLYDVGGMLQYTNRGLGTKPPHIRINCPPEMTLLTLQRR